MAFADGLGTELELDTLGNLTIQGRITTNGSCSAGCDAVFDADYNLPSIESHAEYMFANRHLPTVGPTQSGPIDLSDKVLKMLNELEKAHIYIAQLNERIEVLESKQ